MRGFFMAENLKLSCFMRYTPRSVLLLLHGGFGFYADV